MGLRVLDTDVEAIPMVWLPAGNSLEKLPIAAEAVLGRRKGCQRDDMAVVGVIHDQ